MKIKKNGFIAKSLKGWNIGSYYMMDSGNLSNCMFLLNIFWMIVFGLALGALSGIVITELCVAFVFPFLVFFIDGILYFGKETIVIGVIILGGLYIVSVIIMIHWLYERFVRVKVKSRSFCGYTKLVD